MYRIDHATASPTLPSPTAEGTPAFWINKDGTTGVGTYIDATWLNMVQEELRNIATGAGITPDKLDGGGALIVTQLIQAIRRIAGVNVAVFTATATLTPDAAGIVLLDATAGNVTLTLPGVNSAAGSPLHLEVIRIDATANIGTVQRGGSDTFYPGTATSAALSSQERVIFRGNGNTAWLVRRTQDSAPIVHGAGSGSDVVPAGYTAAETDLQGAGGGAGGCDGTFTGGGGGAGGHTRKFIKGLLPGASYAWLVAAGGAGGIGGANGAAGSAASTFSGTGVSLTANPGQGGVFAAAPAGGDGGTASGGDENDKGGAGGDGFPSGVSMGGNGGVSFWGGGGRASTVTSATVQDGHAAGSGGGAAYLVAGNGGAGKDARLSIRWKP